MKQHLSLLNMRIHLRIQIQRIELLAGLLLTEVTVQALFIRLSLLEQQTMMHQVWEELEQHWLIPNREQQLLLIQR